MKCRLFSIVGDNKEPTYIKEVDYTEGVNSPRYLHTIEGQKPTAGQFEPIAKRHDEQVWRYNHKLSNDMQVPCYLEVKINGY